MTSILSPGQRRLHRVLLGSAAVLLATSLYLYGRAPASGSFPLAFQAILLAHLALGLLVLVPGTVFVLWHLPRALGRSNRVAVASGVALALLGLGLALTGVALAAGGPADRAFWSLALHRAGAAVLPLLYLLHRREGAVRPGLKQVGLAALVVLLGTGALVGVDLVAGPRTGYPVPGPGEVPGARTGPADPFVPWARSPGAPLEGDPFFPSSVLTRSRQLAPDAALLGRGSHGGTPPSRGDKPVSPGAEGCVRCHPDVVAQWESSAHRQSSFANPFYARAVEALRADPDDGVARARWCAGCHDPAVLLTGRWAQPIDREDVHARAGLTCLACHAIESVRDKGGNGGYVLRDDPADPYLGGDAEPGSLAEQVHDGLVKSNPSVHKQQMLVPELFRSGELCGSCHKVSLEAPVNRYRWIRGQNDYDSWHASGANHAAAQTFYLPPVKKTCADCHMPLEPATRGDVSAKGGAVRSHRFAAANLALAQLTGDAAQLAADEAMLRSAVRVDVFALVARGAAVAPLGSVSLASLGPAPTEDELDVVVRNKGTGHAFPGGTIDSNDVWLEVTAKDDQGRVVLANGALDEKGERDPRAHAYRALFLDPRGEPIAKRNPQDIRATVFARTIGPGKADLARYRLAVPEGARRLEVTARLRYRKLDPSYTRYSLGGEPQAPMLVVDCATDTVTLSLDGAPPSAPTTGKAALWERWNDYGIGLLEQGDTRAAVAAFGEVARLAPERADGPRNEARCALREGQVEAALAFLDEAEKRAPADAQNAFFWGEALQRQGRLEDAAGAYARVLERFPQDREARRGLAESRLKAASSPDDYRAALREFLALLRLDPEDRGAHYRRIAIYRALGDEASAAAAEKAYQRFRIDEDSKATAPVEAYERAHAEANLEAQPVHVH